MSQAEEFEREVSSWANVSVHPHRFGGREFRFGSAEIGHIHVGGVLDVPFQRPIHDALLEEQLAEKHHWVPNSGWVTYRIRSHADLPHGLWLMRLSYLRYALKAAPDSQKLFEDASEELHLSPRFKSLLGFFRPKSAEAFSMQNSPA